MASSSGAINILVVDEHLLSLMRVRPTSKGVDVLSHEIERGTWSVADGSLEAALAHFVQQHGLTGEEVYTVLPRHEITSRLLVLPSTDQAELNGMIRLSAEEYVPYPLHDLVIDQCILARLPDGNSRVLAAFAHKDLVNAHLALLQKVGIEPKQIYLSTACLATAAIAAGGPREDRFALVNLSSGGLEALVLSQGRLEYGRAVATVQDWSLEGETQAEALHDLAMEVRASLSAYRRESEDGAGADLVFLCSDWADVTRPASELGEEIGREVAPASFVDNLVVQGREKLKSLAFVSLGAALTAQGRAPVAVNLVPQTVLASRELAQVKRLTLHVAFVAALLVGALGLLYWQAVSQRQTYVRELNAAAAELRPRVEDLRLKQKNLTLLQKQVSREGSLLELLAVVCQSMPEQNINITHVNFRHGEHLGIAGRARDVRYIDRLTETLRVVGASGVPQLAQASQAYANVVQERSADVLNYAIPMPFPRAEGEEERDRE